MELQVGDVIKDNDPRMPNRQLRIVSLEPHYVQACQRHDTSEFPKTVRIRRDRIFGVPRRTGFTLIARGDSLLPYQDRVVKEKAELDKRIAALTTFMTNATRDEVEDWYLLERQLRVMNEYSNLLGERMSLFNRGR